MIGVLSVVVLLGACAEAGGGGDDPGGPGGGASDARAQPLDATPAIDAPAPPIDAALGPDAANADAAPPDAAPGALDPGLSLPDPSGAACTQPGSGGECPLTEVCRFHDADTGRCESCTACGNLGASCSASADCDIVFSCYQGQCTNFCLLGTYGCGPIEDCLDIGHATMGVCDPAGI